MQLLENRFAPATNCIGFLESQFETVCDADRQWRNEIGRFTFQYSAGTLESSLSLLAPLSGPMSRHLWLETHGGWTAYVDNFVIGSDPFGPIAYLSKKLGCRGLLVACHPNIPGKSFGQTRFDLFSPEATGLINPSRTVSATNDDGRWVWNAYGDPLSFEDESAYENKRVRDRLTRTMVADYAMALGVSLFDESFFGLQSCLVSHDGVVPARSRMASFAEIQTELGLR
jgi:hypothetical protein